jgi:4-nitrophenyl phosphatase
MDLTSVRAMMIDMDGVLWRGDRLLDGVHGLFDFLRARSIPFVLVTNSARSTPRAYAARLGGHGVFLPEEQILTSAVATVAHLRRAYPAGARIYAIGEDGLREPLLDAGFELAPDASSPVDAVVVGLDLRFTYDKLKNAALLIRGGAAFFGCNGDLTYPVEEGLAPGAGALLQAIAAATGALPIVIGKPGRLMFEIALGRVRCSPSEAAMLGDRLDADIAGAQHAGIKALFVTTGEDAEADILTKGIYPDGIYRGLPDLVSCFRAALS